MLDQTGFIGLYGWCHFQLLLPVNTCCITSIKAFFSLWEKTLRIVFPFIQIMLPSRLGSTDNSKINSNWNSNITQSHERWLPKKAKTFQAIYSQIPNSIYVHNTSCVLSHVNYLRSQGASHLFFITHPRNTISVQLKPTIIQQKLLWLFTLNPCPFKGLLYYSVQKLNANMKSSDTTSNHQVFSPPSWLCLLSILSPFLSTFTVKS